MSESLLLRPAEAAELLSISRSRLYSLARAGELPGVVRVGGSVRIHRGTLEAWLVEQATRPIKAPVPAQKGTSAKEIARDFTTAGRRP